MDNDLVHAMNVAIECNEVGCILFSVGHSQAALEILKGSTRLVSAVSEGFGLPPHTTNIDSAVERNHLSSPHTCMPSSSHNPTSDIYRLRTNRPRNVPQILHHEADFLLRRAKQHLAGISYPLQHSGCSASGSNNLCANLLNPDEKVCAMMTNSSDSSHDDNGCSGKGRLQRVSAVHSRQEASKRAFDQQASEPQEESRTLLGRPTNVLQQPNDIQGSFQSDDRITRLNSRSVTSIHSVCFQRAVQEAEEEGKRRRLRDREAETRGDCFIFQEPLRLLPYEPTSMSCAIESATMVFNVGLVYHLFGSHTHFLQKALSLYKIAWSLAYSAGLQDSRSHLVAMASLNNAAHIHHSLFEYHLSRQYLEALRQYIISLPRAADYNATTTRQRFAINAMLLNEPKVAKAA